MSKGRIPDKEPEILDGRINPNPNITFANVFGPCNKKICEENAKILLFSKDLFCDILTKAETPQTISAKSVNSCMDIDRPITLVGFYIMPNSTNLVSGGNYLKIQPIYAGQSGNNFTEFLQNPVVINTYEYAEYDLNNFPLVLPHTMNNTYSHNVFQFNADAAAKGFTMAYISWYELKCILDHSDYIGICGSMVMTGNIGSEEVKPNKTLKGICNTAFFTYRIIGYKKHEYKESLPQYAKDKLINRKDFLLKSNQVLKSDGVVTDFMIPTETWTTPCPPMWKPN